MGLQMLIWVVFGASLGTLLRDVFTAGLAYRHVLPGAAVGAVGTGTLFSLLANRDYPGPLDPVSTAVAAMGAVAFILMLDRLPGEAPGKPSGGD